MNSATSCNPAPMHFAFSNIVAALAITSESCCHRHTLGHSQIRKRLDPDFKAQNPPQNVLAMSAAYASYMASSSNIRYQVLRYFTFASFCRVTPPCRSEST